MTTDYQKTRDAQAFMARAVDALTDSLPGPEKDYVDRSSYRWRHKEQTVRLLVLVKSARIVSGLSAAMCLADARFTKEAAAILRMVKDFSNEIAFMAESTDDNSKRQDQDKFIADFFEPFVPGAKRQYVSRKTVDMALDRLERRANADDVGQLRKLAAELQGRLDKNVHGGYENAMYMFDGDTGHFMMQGHRSDREVNSCKQYVAMVTAEALDALHVAADCIGNQALAKDLWDARLALMSSDEYKGQRGN